MAKNLFVEGPCMLEVMRGTATINGGLYREGEKIIVHADRSYLIMCSDDDCIRPLSAHGNVREANEVEVKVSEEWITTAENITNDCASTDKCTVLVLGRTESGKTTFSETLANRMIYNKITPCLIDGDVGQSTIGYPGFISSKIINKRVLWERKPQSEYSYFVGDITPVGHEYKVVLGLTKVLNHYLTNNIRYFIIDTDGWFGDRSSSLYKLLLIQLIKPTHVVCLTNNREECIDFMNVAKKLSPDSKVHIVSSPPVKKERDRTTRRILRGEKILLSELNKRNLNISETPMIGEISIGIGTPTQIPQELKQVAGDVLYAEKQFDKVIVVYKGREIKTQLRSYVFLNEKRFENMIVGLADPTGNHHFGIIQGVSLQSQSIYILTPYQGKIDYILTSRIKYHEGTIVKSVD